MIPGFLEVNQNLQMASQRIEEITDLLVSATTDYLTAEAVYEHELARHTLEAKVSCPEMSQAELKAKAVTLAFADRMKFIAAESTYKRLQNELKALRDKLEVYKELSFNLRRESQIQ